MKLFVSYAHDDMPFCRSLVGLLTAHEVWWDDKLNGGVDWWNTILSHLDWCDGLMYLLSPSSVSSEYCLREAQIALNSDKRLIPVVIHRRTQIPEFLNHIQFVDLSDGLANVPDVVRLMNALFDAERDCQRKHLATTGLAVTDSDLIPPAVNKQRTRYPSSLPYNYTIRLDQKGRSERTKYTYMRWVCDYCEQMLGQPKIESKNRASYLSALPVSLIQESLTPERVTVWLGKLKKDGVAKLGVVKASIVAFAQTIAEDGLIDIELVRELRAIETTKLDVEKRPRRIMSHTEITKLLDAIDSQSKFGQRNAALISLLMVLRSGEVAALKWTDISILGEKVSLRSPVSGQMIPLPRSVQSYVSRWYNTLRINEPDDFNEDSYVIRRFLHGDNVTPFGVTTTSIHNVLSEISQAVLLRKVSPEDLRASARRSIQQKGREQL